MSPFDDDQDMREYEDGDERLLTGQADPARTELAAFVTALRATAAEPAPRPSAALSALLRDGLAPPFARSAVVVAPRRTPWRYVAGLGLAAKILLGAGVAVASVTGAATIDAVPDAVQHPAHAVVAGVVGLFAPAAESGRPAEPEPAEPAPSGSARPAETSSPGAPARSGDGEPLDGSGEQAGALPEVAIPEALPVPSGGEVSGAAQRAAAAAAEAARAAAGAGVDPGAAVVVPDVRGLLRSAGSPGSPGVPPNPAGPPARVGPPVGEADGGVAP